MFGKLYLIATPIGNLGDITYRAVEILKKVDIIAAEDTRHSLKLLNYLDISKPMISYHRHNEDTKTETLINLLKDGKNIGLITDEGTPGISDPGEEVVKEAVTNKPIIIKYASNRLREDKEIGLAAMNVNKNCYEFLGPNLKKDEEILNIKNCT